MYPRSDPEERKGLPHSRHRGPQEPQRWGWPSLRHWVALLQQVLSRGLPLPRLQRLHPTPSLPCQLATAWTLNQPSQPGSWCAARPPQGSCCRAPANCLGHCRHHCPGSSSRVPGHRGPGSSPTQASAHSRTSTGGPAATPLQTAGTAPSTSRPSPFKAMVQGGPRGLQVCLRAPSIPHHSPAPPVWAPWRSKPGSTVSRQLSE